MNKLDPLTRQQVIASLARIQPASVFRLSATSRAMRNATANKRKQLTALKHIIQRKIARRRHFESPIQPGGTRGRLRSPLHEARFRAIARSRMTPKNRNASIASQRRMMAMSAYGTYMTTGTLANWNRFVRIHAKRPGFTAQITRQQARNMYN